MSDDDAGQGGSTRFMPRQSGNRNGRPRRANKVGPAAPFEELRSRMITVQMDGVRHQLSLAEALLQKTFQQALAGGRMAIRVILKKILAHLATSAPTTYNFPTMIYLNAAPQSVDEAMLILGIASQVPERLRENGQAQLALEPWAAARGLKRTKGTSWDEKTIRELKRRVRDPESLAWPSGEDE